MVDDSFSKTDDPCVKNPKGCEKGVSVSIFYKVSLAVNPDDLVSESKNFSRDYILSTGKVLIIHVGGLPS